MHASPKQSGFTLVEMTMVIVIIGALMGMLLGTFHIIRKVRVNKVVEQAERYNQHIQAFREIYHSYPGDFDRAESVWGTATNCNAPAVGKPTCNGNGNGIVQTNGEHFRVWTHLANAGIMEGGWSGAASSPAFVGDVSVPKGALPRSVYVMTGQGAEYGLTNHRIYFVAEGNNVNAAVISPAELGALDQKLDDGVATTGRINGLSGTFATGACLSGNLYDQQNTKVACRMVYWLE